MGLRVATGMSPSHTVSCIRFPAPSYSPTSDPDAPASHPSTFFLEAVRTCECGTKAALLGKTKNSLEASFGLDGWAVKASGHMSSRARGAEQRIGG